MPLEPDLLHAIHAARAGDRKGFDVLVLRFGDAITAFAFALLRDRGLAEDAAQEAFLLAYLNLPRLRDPTAFRPWLYRIAENTALTAWRRRRRGRERPLDEELAREVPAPSGPATGEETAALRASMARLPRHYAGILALRYMRGLSCEELAGVLGLTVTNVKVRLHRARRALRRDLADHGVETAGAST